MILVELAGAGGVGKSTLAPLVAARLREVLGDSSVASLPERELEREKRRWTRINRWMWIATHPWLLRNALELSAPAVRTSRFSAWVRIFSTMGIGRQVLKSGVKVVLVDQGILRLPMVAAQVPMLPLTILPDLVLQVVADAETIELRRIRRQKTKHRRCQGELRFARARDSLRILANLPSEERRAAMVRFGEHFCDPAFSASEIEDLLALPVLPEALATASGKPGRCEPDICALLRQRGLRWKEIDNSQGAEIKQVVEACVEEILAARAACDQRKAAG